MSEEQLEECPFCGSPAERAGGHKKLYACSNQSCCNTLSMFTVEEWQRRPIEDRLRAEISTLQATIDDLRTTTADAQKYLEEVKEKLHQAVGLIREHAPKCRRCGDLATQSYDGDGGISFSCDKHRSFGDTHDYRGDGIRAFLETMED
jgi:hypothetical protein